MSTSIHTTDTTMEELLHTIRNVISGNPTTASTAVATTQDNEEEPLLLTEIVNDDGSITSYLPDNFAEEAPQEEDSETIYQSILISQSVPKHQQAKQTQPHQETHHDRATAQSLLSDKVATESTNAISELISSIPKKNFDDVPFRSGTTMEELVIETIKPELSAWMDKHLSGIVTQIVEREIRRIVVHAEDKQDA